MREEHATDEHVPQHPAGRQRVLVLATAFEPAVRAGGPVRSLANLVDMTALQHEVTVVAPDRDLGDRAAFPEAADTPVDRQGATIHYVRLRDPMQVIQIVRHVRRRNFDIAILNSYWNLPLALIPALLLRARVVQASTVVLMPRGELDQGALRFKSIKKRLAMPVFRWIYLRTAHAIGATSEREYLDVQKWLPGASVLLTDNEPDCIAFDPVGPSSAEPRLLFLGRIDRKKGLLEALKGLALTQTSLSLDIVGPSGDSEYWAECQNVIASMPDRVSIRALGTASRSEVPGLLHNHDLILNLTAGENFGHTFVEALQAGCPVLATAESPWTQHLQAGGGWIVADRGDATEVARVIDSLLPDLVGRRPAMRAAARSAYEAWARHRPTNVVEQAAALRG